MRETIRIRPDVAANAVISMLELVATDAAGDAVPFTGASGQTFLGYSEEPCDNTGGSAGTKKILVTSGVEEIDIAAGITPKPGQQAFVATSTSLTNAVPVADAAAKFVAVFIRQSQIHPTKWVVDFRPSYYRYRPAVA